MGGELFHLSSLPFISFYVNEEEEARRSTHVCSKKEFNCGYKERRGGAVVKEMKEGRSEQVGVRSGW